MHVTSLCLSAIYSCSIHCSHKQYKKQVRTFLYGRSQEKSINVIVRFEQRRGILSLIQLLIYSSIIDHRQGNRLNWHFCVLQKVIKYVIDQAAGQTLIREHEYIRRPIGISAIIRPSNNIYICISKTKDQVRSPDLMQACHSVIKYNLLFFRVLHTSATRSLQPRNVFDQLDITML